MNAPATPQDIAELEREAVACAYSDPSTLPYLSDHLPWQDVTTPHLQALYGATLQTWREHGSADLPLVMALLRERGLWGEVVTSTSIGWVLDYQGSPIALPEYVRRIRANAAEVRLRIAGQDVAKGPDARGAALRLVREVEGDGDDWPTLQPLGSLGDVPPFPVEALPDALADWCRWISHTVQVPVELPAMVVLAVVGAAAAKTAVVRVTSSYREPIHPWIVVAAPPSTRKSPVFSAATRPLREWEYDRQRARAPEIAKAIARLETERKTLGGLQSKAAKITVPHERDDALHRVEEQARLVADLEEQTEIPPRIMTGDTTPEALLELLAQYDGRMAVLSDEGGVLGTMAGRYSSGVAHLDAFLQGYSGGGVIHVDRKGSGHRSVADPAVTLGLCVQPQVLSEAWARPDVRDRGLLARPLFCLTDGGVGNRIAPYLLPDVPDAVLTAYHATVTRLLARPLVKDGQGRTIPDDMALSGHAREVLCAWHDECEPQLAEGGRLASIRDWGGKLHGNTLRLAGLLHLAAEGDAHLPISGETAEAAVEIARYCVAQALRLFGSVSQTQEERDAEAVLEVLRKADRRASTREKLRQDSRLRRRQVTGERLDRALTVLQTYGYVRLGGGAVLVSPRVEEAR